MEFRILGPLEVVRDGQPVDLGPPQQRALLALLLIHPTRVLTTDRIMEELWGDDAAGKENALWVYVSRLRSALEPDRSDRGQSSVLITRDHGYMLSVDPPSIDAHEFEKAAAEGRALIKDDPRAASEMLAQALQLWRGSALEDFAYDDFAQIEMARLETLRLTAVEDRIEADLRQGKAGELVSELEKLRSLHPTRESFVTQLMLALYQSGRQGEALRAFESFRRWVGEELGVEPSPELCRLEEQVLLHDPGIRVRLPGVERVRTLSGSAQNPFKGLRAFSVDDSKEFFGRDRLVADVVRRIGRGDRLIALVGPSGSGKSSVLKAGLIPALRKDVITGSEGWAIARMVPGARPFAELEVALLRSSLDAPNSLSEQLADPEDGALRAALRVLPGEDSRLLLAIDQFEELFTLVEDEDERSRFISNLVPLIDDPHGRVTVVLTLRADFYDQPLAFPEFGNRLSDGVVNVVPLTSDELEDAAQKPAEAAGVSIAPALLASLLTDVVGRPGSLPLFQYTLTELFDHRIGDALTLDDYRAMDGLRGALTRRADELYAALDPEQQAAAKQLLLRLVTIVDDDEWGRRRVPASEIVSLGVDLVAAQGVIELFAGHRLLTVDRDSVTGSPTVEVAHEALLTEWGRLRGWIEESREDVKRHAVLTAAMNEWIESGRDPDFLLTGSRLDRYERWAATASLHLTSHQREYLDMAVEAREHARRFEDERSAQEEKTKRAARRRLWALGTTVLLLVVLGASLLILANQPEPIRVAMVAPSAEHRGSSGLLEVGIAKAERELPVEVHFLRRVTSLESEYRDLAEARTDLIFIDPDNSGWEWVPEVISDYPGTGFAVIDGIIPAAGAHSAYIADVDAGYVAGLAAALKTETGVIGFVGGKQTATTQLWRAGFEAGAEAGDARIEVVAIAYGTDAGETQDVAGAEAAADKLFQLDADVVLAVAGDANLGVIEAAWENSRDTGVHRWAIASGSDWSVEVADHLGPHILTSALKKWDVAVFETIRAFVEGAFTPGITVLTLADGAVGLAPSVHLTDQDMTRIGELSANVAEGAIALPRVPSRELLPPPGFDLSDTLTVTWDGDTCSYAADSTTFNAGAGLRIEFVNRSAKYRQFWALHHVGLSTDILLSTLVPPTSDGVGHIVPVHGTVEINCGPDLRGGEASRPVTATTLTIK